MVCSFPCYLLPATMTTNATSADGHQMVRWSAAAALGEVLNGRSFAAQREPVNGNW